MLLAGKFEKKGFAFAASLGGVLLFGVSLLMPAIYLEWGAWETGERRPVEGWLVASVSWRFYVSNMAVVSCPFWVFLPGHRRNSRRVLWGLLAIYVVSPAMVLIDVDTISGVAVGFYFWLAAYFACALGVGIRLLGRGELPGECLVE